MQCKKCNTPFKRWIKIDNKLRNLNNRKYCFSCSPYKLHNTKQIEKVKITKKGEECICSLCNRDFIYKRNSGGTKQKCNTCATNYRRFALKEKAIEYKGNKCSVCGYNRSKRSLVFHHLDPSQKDFQLSGNHCRRWEVVKKELDKCILLCSNCHNEEHDKIDKL